MKHRVLERQIRRTLGDVLDSELDPKLSQLIEIISETYTHFDEDRKLLLRSLDISSKEFVELNKKLQLENEIIEKTVANRTQELSFEQAKLIQIAEHMTTGALLLDVDGRVTFTNKEALELLGFPSENKEIIRLQEEFPDTKINEMIASALSGKTIELLEVENAKGIFSISFVSLLQESETFGCLIWIRNITQPKQLERAKNQFLAIASHEMRTPLAIIRGNAELLLESPSLKNQNDDKEQVSSILNSAVRLLGIVNDFLDVQHIESGNISLKKEKIDLVLLLTTTIHDFKKQAAEKNITVELSSDLPEVSLSTDKYRMQQICINVISNAIHYTNEGGVYVKIQQDGDAFRVIFKDTGIGISPEDQVGLFQKFHTSKTFLRSKEYGSGLGLYISNMLAKYMGFSLNLTTSAVGVGTVFTLTIPKEHMFKE